MDKEYIVDSELRLDKFLASKLDQTRNQIEQLIKKGFVSVNDKNTTKTGLKLKVNQKVLVELPKMQKSEAQEVNFDVEVIYEDDYMLIINKPDGVIVHDAPSVNEATLVDWLKLKNISLSTISGEERHGIVHRLDKGTSGLLVVAKTNDAHVKLSEQLQDKSMGRYYLAVVDLPLKDNTVVEKPIGRHQNNRLKMGINQNGKEAKTAFKKLVANKNEEHNSKKYELIAAKLFTGRTHQIRVHLESIGRHILGDDLYGFKGKDASISRIYLHAYCLYLNHPITNEKMEFVSNIPDNMTQALQNNFNGDLIDEKVTKEFISSSFNNTDSWVYA
jgi:23S rRNA pseudouridine1911/1915/1917 synthase